ncbi:MAG: hypothetical protein FP825_13200 [Hyphomonas sp.]|uniref:hypothetical protein n=1 Tax=Hyphomonas sp. TaxID=87 RepID=UPI0017E9E670|nr:hypothetical protein [Hyphomonas sp.]MBA3069422.1 hypothetical protein [Hyphomonas sp.]MBU3920288.1 hypothetical protein [Alphaproteobacteria bacterium]MBU4063804.1 hypothetical protein [Alphaproteobacteria bacterium]MBU4164235.1 hypothetical protein [Alphaproteobacteria bacterium]
MQEPNRDVFPTPAMLERFANITPLLKNDAVESAFSRHEALSIAGKKMFHRLGLVSMVLIGGSAIYTIAEALLFKGGADPAIGMAAAVAAAVGIAAQVFSLIAQLKSKWLVNRFACERLRSIKFQAYSLAATAPDEADLAARTRKLSAEELAKLESELNMGISIFEAFVPEKCVAVPEPGPGPADPAIISEATIAYRELRLLYQDRFAAAELHRLRENRRAFHSAADILYFSGACLVLLSLLAKIVPGMPISAWVDFLAISAFVLSISKTVLDNASLTDPSAARFVRYREDIAEIERRIERGASLDIVVPQMERIALGELEEFCDASKSINYRL